MRALTTATGILRQKQLLSRFGQNQHAGLKSLEIGADRPRKIQRAIEDATRAETLPRQFLAGSGSGGDGNGVVRQIGVERLDQARDGQNFAHRDRVEPDQWAPFGLEIRQMRRHCAEPLAQALAVFMGGGHPP